MLKSYWQIESNMSAKIQRAGIPLHPFLFMGCWNQHSFPPGSNSKTSVLPRDAVAEAIQKSDIPTLVLGGDNVYPRRDSSTGKKIHLVKDFKEGIELLKGKQIFSSLGNHNIDPGMLEAQVGASEWVLPERYYATLFTDNTALVVIDTNLVEKEQEKEFATMLLWLQDILARLKAASISYYLIQHEPFVSFRKAKKFDYPVSSVLTRASDILYRIAEYPPIAVLCADTHNFQTGIITVAKTVSVKIPQYVVGTGGGFPDEFGTKMDSILTSAPITIGPSDITYSPTDYQTGYGFLEVYSPSSSSSLFVFKKVMEWLPPSSVTNIKNKNTNKNTKGTNAPTVALGGSLSRPTNAPTGGSGTGIVSNSSSSTFRKWNRNSNNAIKTQKRTQKKPNFKRRNNSSWRW